MKDSAHLHQSGTEGRWSWHGGGGVIWQLMFPGRGLVAGINRYPEQRRATLFCLETETGRVLCDDFVLTGEGEGAGPVGDGWMIGLETTTEGLLFCHTFQPGSPEHQGIWAVDLPGKTVVWSRPDLVFAANLGDSFLAYRTRVFAGFPEREYLLIDPRTGLESDSLGSGAGRANELRQAASSEQERQGIVLPVAGTELSGHVESIDTGGVKVTARHGMTTAENGLALWSSVLTITSGDRMLYRDTMAASLAVPLFNNFLIREERLYYIKDKEVLISVAVS